jgi:tetratricopeptide (TPR) repeat protein
MTFDSKHVSHLSALLIWVGAFVVGSQLLARHPAQINEQTDASLYLLGPARALLSAGLYERADTYFHKGAPRHKEEAFRSFFQVWREQINPTKHRHAESQEIMEIMPWLRLATQADPTNIEAYLVAAYWLSNECNQPEQALLVIEEAIARNPQRYEVHMEKGRLFLSMDDLASADAAFETTCKIMDTYEATGPEQTAIDRSFILMARSFLFEAGGNREAAIAMARQNALLHPERSALAQRLQQLEENPLHAERAKARLAELFSTTHVCNHGEAETHAHDEHCGAEEHVHNEHCNHD